MNKDEEFFDMPGYKRAQEIRRQQRLAAQFEYEAQLRFVTFCAEQDKKAHDYDAIRASAITIYTRREKVAMKINSVFCALEKISNKKIYL